MSRHPTEANVGASPKPSWRCGDCRRPDGKGWVSFGWQKHCSRCGIDKGNCFGGNLPPATVSTSIRRTAIAANAWKKDGPGLAAQLKEFQRQFKEALAAAKRPPPAAVIDVEADDMDTEVPGEQPEYSVEELRALLP